jgi:D-hydroxyproline dehydrogenase subunit beta
MTVLSADLVVVGAGIVGLANAWAAAKRGLSVLVVDRFTAPKGAQGASVRNFGMFWPVGQPPGPLHDLALFSRSLWLDIAREAGFWHDACGSLHLAVEPDALDVMAEFATKARDLGFDVALLSKAETLARSPAANPDTVLGSLWSPTEICVDSRDAIATIPRYLEKRFGVRFLYGQTVVGVDGASGPNDTVTVRLANGERFTAGRAMVATGEDLFGLFPKAYEGSGMRRCKLQMLRTVPQPDGFRMGPMIASGLTLRHYKAFEICESLAPYRARISREQPWLDQYGIHVMASQHGHGMVTLGDSHEYDGDILPFDRQFIDDEILRHLKQMMRLPSWELAETWSGIYAKHPALTCFRADPLPGVHIMNGMGGSGMTMSFAHAEKWWAQHEGPLRTA